MSLCLKKVFISNNGLNSFRIGVQEAIKAGENLKKNNYKFDIAYTSVLKRAICTFNNLADSLDCHHIPLIKSWRLNERHYGQLQGLNKKETTQKHGEAQVQLWRRSYDVPPPAVSPQDKNYPGNDEKYKGLNKAVLPRGESLKLTSERVLPFFHDFVARDLKEGKKVLVVAHGNSLRAIVKFLNEIGDGEIAEFNIPTAVPLVYEFGGELNVEKSFFLESDEELRRKMEAVKQQSKEK